MDEEFTPTPSPEQATNKPEAPKLRSVRYELAMGEIPDNAISELHISRSKELEDAMLQINALWLHAGDTFVLTGGKLEIFRRGAKLGEWIVDERLDRIEKTYAQAVTETREACHENCESLAQDIHSQSPEETSTPVPNIDWNTSFVETPKIQQLSKQEVRDRIYPALERLAAGFSEKWASTISGPTLIQVLRIESYADQNAKSGAGAQGLMQVNGVLDDMVQRFPIYQKYFAKVPEDIIAQASPEEAVSILREVREIARKPSKKITTEDIAVCQEQVQKLKPYITDPFVNSITGSIYCTSLAETVEVLPPEKFGPIVEKLAKQRGVINYRRHNKKEPYLKKPVYEEFIGQLRENSYLQRKFITLAGYNGGPNKLHAPGKHPYIFAALVILGEMYPAKVV